MFRMKLATGLLSALLLLPGFAWAKPLHFQVAGDADDTVKFTSNAPMEIINGDTHGVTGRILLDDSFKFDARHPFDIVFSVDLSTFDTGIALRNQHMRDKYLETNQYPKATFKATRIKLAKKPDLHKPQTVDLTATGDFSLHGVTVKKTIPLQVAYQPGTGDQPASVRIKGKFPVPLAQHHIKRPEVVMVKLADTIYVNVDLTGSAP
jgi:polyisoprenoid-binding protein YceI